MQRMKPAAAAHIATVDFKTASSCNIPAPHARILNTSYHNHHIQMYLCGRTTAYARLYCSRPWPVL